MEPYDIYVVDTETTDKEAKNAHIVEIAILGHGGAELDTLVKPPIPIPAETSAVHHITDEDVSTALPWESVKSVIDNNIFLNREGKKLPVFVAHNCKYDREVLGSDFGPCLWICTYKVALRVWPDAPSHKNEVLRYWLKLGDNRGRSGLQGSHSAMHDAKVTMLLFNELCGHVTISQMIEWTEQPALLPKMPMGKYFGQKWRDIPYDYLIWITRNITDNEDLLYCAREELKRRR